MQTISQGVSSTMNRLRVKVIMNNTKELLMHLSEDTVQDIRQILYEWSRNDVAGFGSDNPVTYSVFMVEYIKQNLETFDALTKTPQYQEYQDFTYDEVVADIIENDYWLFLDEFSLFAKENVDQLAKFAERRVR